MKFSFPIRGLAVFFLATFSVCCKKSELEKRLIIHDNEVIKLKHPKKIVGELLNPASPLWVNEELVFSESGSGTISKVVDGKVVPLITGFASDNYGGYNISAQGITVDEKSGFWIVCAAEGAGKVFIYDPKKFPLKANEGREGTLVGARDDNPWESVIIKDIIIASGGTKKQYRGKFDLINPVVLSPSFSVETGLIGIVKHPSLDMIYGAEFGVPPNGGAVIKWDTGNAGVTDSSVAGYQTVVKGLRNLVDVAFTGNGTLLALEFGEFNTTESGRLLVVDEKTGKATPVLEGLNSPSGFSIDKKNNKIYISEFGVPANKKNGNVISLDYNEEQ